MLNLAAPLNQPFLSSPKTPKVVFDNGITATLQHTECLCLRRPLVNNRATCVIAVKSSSVGDTEGDLVLKACWPESSRLNEAEVINAARDALCDSEEVADKDLAKHLPDLVASQDVPHSDTSIILQDLAIATTHKEPRSRVLRLLLFRRYVSFEEIDEEKFMKGWLDCFKCHYALWEKGFKHRNIGVWDLMWDEKEECGILNDWDLTRVRGGIANSNAEVLHDDGERLTGTMPFIARDLLWEDLPVRLFRHEFESFVWVYTWVCLMDTHPDKLRSWCIGTNAAICNAKGSMVTPSHARYNSVKTNAWNKCKLLLSMLLDIDLARTIGGKSGVPTEPSPEEIYEEVLKIMTDDTYSDVHLPFLEQAKASARKQSGQFQH